MCLSTSKVEIYVALDNIQREYNAVGWKHMSVFIRDIATIAKSYGSFNLERCNVSLMLVTIKGINGLGRVR